MTKLKTRLRSKFMVVAMMFALLFQVFMPAGNVFAEGTQKEVDVEITDFEIQNTKKEKVDKIFHSDTFYLMMKWDASKHGANLHKGDYFNVKLPNTMKFPSDVTARNFDIKNDDGVVIAKAQVNPGLNDEGGTVRVTFTENVENKYNVKGTMYLAAQFAQTKVKMNEKNVFEISVGVKTKSTDTEIIGRKKITDEHLSKWGGKVIGNSNLAEWNARINHKKANLKNAIVEDSLVGTGETFVEGSFVLRKVQFDEYGDYDKNSAQIVDISSKLKLSADKKTFRLELGDTSDQYSLTYRSTYTPGTTLKNKLKLTSEQKNWVVTASHILAESGGHGDGDLASKIKLIKVDAENNTKGLANAVFEVKKPDGTSFELKTGADGTVVSGVLEQGIYKVKEKTPPRGYELGNEEFEMEVTPAGGAIKTITNKPIKIDVSVKKVWVDKKENSARVSLFADGVKIQTVELNESNNWKHTFTNLRKFKDGKVIKYEVREEQMPNYKSEISGDVENGFTIKNTNTEKILIPVKKIWVGKKENSARVSLFADGVKIQTVELNESNNWLHVFTNLKKYKDGKAIKYEVREEQMPNYKSEITGNATTGFVIKNTNTEKISVPVKKIWVGKKENSARVSLFADNEKIQTVELNEANDWQHTFTNLKKYKDGKAIKYEVREEQMPNYKSEISGDVENGFVIKNTNTEEISIPIKKVWVGKKLNEITVNLLKDGVRIDSVKLNDGNGWKHRFENLEKYDKNDGHEIKYDIEEEKVSGYTTAITGDAKNGFEITNTKDTPPTPPTPPNKTVPKTEDRTNPFLYAWLMFVSGSLLVLLGIRKRQQQ
ncbi:Cna B-type domain-containing protein [Bulleidia sp. zg-1006]|uniref:Cna B-type domain-containing protein n=1 Tax=Bulleidia sp. zg-1006 TaxID=2806552 RepID=UPI00193A558C|nr:Cna B-type domain-containing protein [Bulleidia sp. zg-1006]QRG86656.1 Cna B-type domain-containing protein [Bulleidia sp. zg-1006]